MSAKRKIRMAADLAMSMLLPVLIAMSGTASAWFIHLLASYWGFVLMCLHDFRGFEEPESHNTDPNVFLRTI